MLAVIAQFTAHGDFITVSLFANLLISLLLILVQFINNSFDVLLYGLVGHGLLDLCK